MLPVHFWSTQGHGPEKNIQFPTCTLFWAKKKEAQNYFNNNLKYSTFIWTLTQLSLFIFLWANFQEISYIRGVKKHARLVALFLYILQLFIFPIFYVSKSS